MPQQKIWLLRPGCSHNKTSINTPGPFLNISLILWNLWLFIYRILNIETLRCFKNMLMWIFFWNWRLWTGVTKVHADDLSLLAKEEKVLQNMIDKLIKIGRCYGMEMNVEKTKVMRISRQPSPVKIMIDQK